MTPAASTTLERHKRTAERFLRMVGVEGKAREAFEAHVADGFVHHNPWVPAGREALLRALEDAHRDRPNEALEVRHAIAEGDLVVTHSRVRRRGAKRDFVAVHVFRFEGDEVVELWDVGMEPPADSPNESGLF